MESSADQLTGASSATPPKLEIQSHGSPVSLFPTACFVVEHQGTEPMNDELVRFCLEQEKNQAGLQTGSIQGYHSDRQFFDNDNWAVQQLKELMIDNARKYLQEYWKSESVTPLSSVRDLSLQLSGWSVLLREGDFSKPHTHPTSHISGVYYVMTKESSQQSQSDEGNLVLVDPRIRASGSPLKGQKSNAMFSPKAGMAVMFPSWLEHFVLPFKGDGLRISIACNFVLSPSALQHD